MIERRSARRRRARRAPSPAEPDLHALEGIDLASLPAVAVRSGGPAGTTTYVGRAPVFDRRLDVAGFHLLIDEFGAGHGAETDADRSRRLLTRALLEVGLDSLIGGRLGFVEMPVDLLADGSHLALPPHRITIEAIGPIGRDALDVLRDAHHQGYRVLIGRLGACSHPREAIRLTSGVRVDASSEPIDEVVSEVLAANPRAQVLVSGLPDDGAVEHCRSLGVTWLRGEVLRPAEQVDEPTVPLHRLAVLQLLAELEDPEVDFDAIDHLISVDLGMSYKILRMANSSYLALERRVERTRDAVVYLGIDTVRAVAALLALSEASDHPPEIAQLSLIRARHCEELVRSRRPELGHAAFTAGLFSSLDVLLGLSMDQILFRIPVADHIADALRSRTGPLGKVVEIALAYERGDLARMSALGADPATTVLAYRRALEWMSSITTALHGPARAGA